MYQFAPTWYDYSLRPGKEFRKVKSVLGSKPGEGGFNILETNHDRRTSPRQKLFAPTRILQYERPQPPENYSGFESG
jgi:hypothetical protein